MLSILENVFGEQIFYLFESVFLFLSRTHGKNFSLVIYVDHILITTNIGKEFSKLRMEEKDKSEVGGGIILTTLLGMSVEDTENSSKVAAQKND